MKGDYKRADINLMVIKTHINITENNFMGNKTHIKIMLTHSQLIKYYNKLIN